MKVTVEWLKEFVDTDATAQEIGDELTMLGLELETSEESALGPVLDFKVTPNRGDCLSVFGLARELAAKDAQKYRPTELFLRAAAGFSPQLAGDSAQVPSGSAQVADDSAPGLSGSAPGISGSQLVAIESPELCARYVGAIISGVRVGSSPEKIAARLAACGMRPIDSIVDTTNYVMLELGQPLHAFDLRQLKGGRIVVRTAKPGETMKTLDGQERKLTPEMLMICDAERPVAIAGVMGGENSEVASDTTEILLESAHFDAVSIRRTRRALGMSTEASYRFERFVDPELCLAACRRVVELLGGTAVTASHDAYPGNQERASIVVREARWNKLLGMQVPQASAAAILVSLGCQVGEVAEGLSVKPPSWRDDVQIEEDLVEEIGRIWGYERIPEALPFGSPQGGYGPEASFRKRVRSILLRLGFAETLTHTLAGESPLGTGNIAVRNAASPELSRLRSSMLPGIAEAASRNRGRPLALFEIGRVFSKVGERRSLGILAFGDVNPPHWGGGKAEKHDFYSVKGIVEVLGGLLHRPVTFESTDDSRFHPGRRAGILAGGERLGVVGEVSPGICEALDLPVGTLAAEMDLDVLMSAPTREPVYERLSAFPSVRRDFAVIVPKVVPFAELEAALREAAQGLAERVWLFDVYEGKGIEPGRHSLGIGVILRHQERTLTDDEANAFSERALAALEALGGERRT